MGNAQMNVMKEILCEGNTEKLRTMLANSRSRSLLNEPLNKKGDTALMLFVRHNLDNCDALRTLISAGCDVNIQNRDGKRVLDLALEQVLPRDDQILENHFSADAAAGRVFYLSESVCTLLSANAQGASLHRLILCTMKIPHVIHAIISSIPHLHKREHYRTSGLLLQVAVWFGQTDNLRLLLERGHDADHFWRAPFMPEIVVGHVNRSRIKRHKREQSGEYDAVSFSECESVQSLKLCFVQDWQACEQSADHEAGHQVPQDPLVPYRAGLLLPPSSALPFIRAANTYSLLEKIVGDMVRYMPCICNGPNICDSRIMHYLDCAGYQFSEEEIQYFELRFGVDFSWYYPAGDNRLLSLKHMCRLSIRFNMNVNVVHGVSQLNTIPPPLQKYLLLNDVDRDCRSDPTDGVL